jgi:ribosome biogenesis protein ERB1
VVAEQGRVYSFCRGVSTTRIPCEHRLTSRSAGRIYLLAPLALISPHVAQATLTHLNTAFSSSSASTTTAGKPTVPDAKWVRPSEDERDRGMMIIVEVQGTPKQLTWHRKGDYFASVAVDGK